MFTGIITAIGRIGKIRKVAGDYSLDVVVSSDKYQAIELGESIAVNGVCLTVTAIHEPNGFCVDVSQETMRCTTLMHLKENNPVNLERALLPTDRLGGHLVSGHVDGVARIVSIQPEARSYRVVMAVPQDLANYIAAKGSITVDGVSLTVNEVSASSFTVNIVPHTWQQTIFSEYRAETPVNIEVDVIARYLERLINSSSEQSTQNSDLTLSLLASCGFMEPSQK